MDDTPAPAAAVHSLPPTAKRRRRWPLILLAVLVLAAAIAAGAWRWTHGDDDDGTIAIAVVYSNDQDSDDFLAGVRIAIAQLNAQGGILGRPVSERVFQEDAYTDQVALDKLVVRTLRLATRIGKMPSVLAVIGHGSSSTAIPASAVYNRTGKLFLATHATATSLSNHSQDLTFALQPSNADNAAVLAEYARAKGLRRFVILSDNSNYGIETTDRFRAQLAESGGTILYRDRLTSSNKSIDDLLLFLLDNSLFRRNDIDAIFLTSSSMEDSARFIARARQLGLAMPILGPEYLTSRDVEEAVGQAMLSVVAVSLFDGNIDTAEGENLRTAFRRATGRPPGLLAAIGFDAVKVLAYATNRTKTLNPAAIADTLRIIRYEAPFIGATGPLAFDAHGLVTDTKAYVVRHDGTSFRTVATYRKPLIPGEDQNTDNATGSEPTRLERISP